MDPKGKQLLPSTGQSLEKISRLFGINLSSYLGKLYSLTILVLFSFLNYVIWRGVCIDRCAQHIVKKFMMMLQYVLYVLLVLTMMVSSLFRPEQFAFPLQKMSILDSILQSYGAQFSNKDIFIMKHLQDAAMVAISLLITIIFSYEIITSNSTELIWFSILSWYSEICLLVANGLFSHYLNDMYLRFRELNKIMIQHSKDKLLVFYIDFTTADACNKRNDHVTSKIRSIQYVHQALTVLAMKINANFSLQLLISFTLSLNAIISYLYDIYCTYNIKTDNGEGGIVFEIFFQIIFVLWNVLLSLYISYICQRTRNESRRMTKILHRVFLKYKALRSEVIYFSLQLIHKDLMFIACGLFEINLPVMCSIAGAVVTYLPMVIQLDTTTSFPIATTTQSYVGDNFTSSVV